jgi:threonine synthase
VAAASGIMTTVPALSGHRCVECGERGGPAADAGTCPACGGPLRLAFDHKAIQVEPAAGGSDPFLEASGLDALRGLVPDAVPDLSTGETPLLAAEGLADNLGVASVEIKAEGRNPTGSLADREMALAVGAAAGAGATDVALPAMGHGAQAAAAAAARSGLASHTFVPARTPFLNKAMINVHGGDMRVVEGRYREAETAFREDVAESDWHSLAPFETPFRAAGVKPLAYEVAAARDWQAPDWVVVPTGQVTALVGIASGFTDLQEVGLIERVPRVVAAQAAGCAPVADAISDDREVPAAIDHPDTVVGSLEIPDPAGARLAVDAIRDTGGTALAVEDATILEAATSLAERGLPVSVTGGAGIAAVRTIRDRGRLDPTDHVVLVDPVAASKEADLLRSHLMSQGR